MIYCTKLPMKLCLKETRFTHIILYAAHCLSFLFRNLQSQGFQQSMIVNRTDLPASLEYRQAQILWSTSYIWRSFFLCLGAPFHRCTQQISRLGLFAPSCVFCTCNLLPVPHSTSNLEGDSGHKFVEDIYESWKSDSFFSACLLSCMRKNI